MRRTRARQRNGEARVLPASAIIDTGGTQHAEWNSRPIVGRLLRHRHELAVSLLPPRRGRLLEIGYGSGFLMPELARHCDELYGLDVHEKPHEVAAVLARFDVAASLQTGTATAMPYPDRFFDCVVAESVLAHIEDLDRAISEVHRVVDRGGSLVAVVPADSRLVDAALRALTGANAKADFGDRRRAVLPALLRHFDVDEQCSYPRRDIAGLRLYTALRLRPRD
jgi:SAM-dependent methyltransferase